MAKARRTPAEKKRFSYERDGRNTYGRNNKAARKAIPAFKASSSRALRHAVKQTLEQSGSAEFVERAEVKIADETFMGLHPVKRKASDQALGVVIALKKKKANARIGQKIARQKKMNAP